MARYFFDLREGTELFLDEDGVDCAGIGAAQELARKAASGLIASAVGGGEADYQAALAVRDDDGAPVFTLFFSSPVHCEFRD
ncbi:hypothetical protein [Sphingopyxis sp. KK2]|uniref:DUF6894 family protein n=1 Tax=Sphingopyxis sp. KK2 TaxID=1855727 RepID=UPI00097E7457|nr:hypothetical protein [Sphingopyxis sp. KK2]